MVTANQLKAQAVLVRHARDFDDFDFEDVHRDLYDVLTRTEIEEIGAIESGAEQNELLFFHLSLNPDKLIAFIEAISEKYKWLASLMKRSMQDDSDRDELLAIRHKIAVLHSQIPRLTDYNVHRLKYLFAIQKALTTLEPMQCLILNGNLQFGKKWLAIDACSNYQVMRTMGTNVFYINLSNCNTKEAILEQMVLLYSLIAPADRTLPPSYDENITNKIVLLKPVLIDLLRQYPDCLLILSSVPSVEAMDAFRLQCKIMLTTRDKALQDEWPMANRIVFDIERGLTPDQSRQLFAKVLKMRPNDLPPEAIEIDELCSGNPCLIWVVASNLQSYVSVSQVPWQKWVATLVKNESTSHDSFRVVIEQALNSLSVLTEQDLKYFYSLAIFGENAKIPLSLLQRYWSKSESDVEEMVHSFDRLYLVDIVKQRPTFCTLQYHYWSYLSHNVDQSTKRAMHKELVNCYRIETAINTRTDTSLVLPDDRYFFFYIARHICEAQMVHLLPLLYLDFGFLEQKLRATGLPNTIGDLQTYSTEIIADLPERGLLFEEILNFLPNVEEMLKKSKDTCLLQYALMTHGHLKAEAKRQASRFRHRLFLDGSDHIYHHRQIVALPRRPVFNRFCGPTSSLIAFIDHSIWLVDLSPGYTVSPTLYDAHKETVCDIQMLSDDHFVSLDTQGCCYVWSMQNTPINRKRAKSNSHQLHLAANHNNNNYHDIRNGIRQSRAESFDKHRTIQKTPQQTLKMERPGDSIQCLTLMHSADRKTVTRVIFGTESGRILIYNWGNNELTCDWTENTAIGPIHSIVPVRSNFLVILSKAGILWRVNTKNMSPTRLDGMPPAAIIQPIVGLHELSDQSYASTAADSNCAVLVVFANRVLRVTLSCDTAQLDEVHELFAPSPDSNRIMCSVLSKDHKYQILGTERGLVVYDVPGQRVMLRRSVSDTITCVDIHSLDSALYRYVLMCGTLQNDKLSYVYGLEKFGHGSLMDWSPNRMGSPINIDALLGNDQLNTWLLGGRLFAVTDVDADTDDFALAAVDSRGDIYRKSSVDEFQGSERIQCDHGAAKIRVLATGGELVFVGCNDGVVYDSLGEKLIQMRGPVRFLRYFHQRLLVAGSENAYRMSHFEKEVPSRELAEAYLLGAGRFVLLVKVDATFKLFDLVEKKFVQSDLDTFDDERLGGCHLLDDRFAMASRNELQFWTLAQSGESCKLVPWHNNNKVLLNSTTTTYTKLEPATCVRLATASEYCAVGFTHGLIQLFRLDQQRAKLVHQLESHATRIHTLVFSPWTSVNRKPVILASVAEQLCFWNVTFAVNNPTIDDDPPSISDRFPDRISGPQSEPRHTSDDDDETVSPWIGKLGPPGKQELLACYRFNGNEAQQLFANADFTTFLTIDDVGEIYFLKVSKPKEDPATNGADVSDSGVDDDVFLEMELMNVNDADF